MVSVTVVTRRCGALLLACLVVTGELASTFLRGTPPTCHPRGERAFPLSLPPESRSGEYARRPARRPRKKVSATPRLLPQGRLYGMVSDRSSRVRRIRSSRTAERSETAEGRDRDDIPPNRDYAIDIIAYESFRELDLVGRMGVAML